MTGSRLNHLNMTHIYKEELDEIDMKLMINNFIKVKKSRTAILDCINSKHLFALVHLLLLFNTISSLCSLSISPEIVRFLVKFSGNFREY